MQDICNLYKQAL